MITCLKFAIPPVRELGGLEYYALKDGFIRNLVYEICPGTCSWSRKIKENECVYVYIVLDIPYYYNDPESKEGYEQRIKNEIHNAGIVHWQNEYYSGEFNSGHIKLPKQQTKEERIETIKKFNIPDDFKQSLIFDEQVR